MLDFYQYVLFSSPYAGPCLSDGCPVWCHCGGTSPGSLWQMDTVDTMRITVDTSGCAFNKTPLYFTTIGGTSSHFALASYGAIYSPTLSSFIVYTSPLVGSNVTDMLNYALLCTWNIHWYGAVL
jgi:hypothetical protein